MEKKKALFISSAGGHFSELMMLKPIFDKFDYHIITEKLSSTKSLKETYGDKIDFLVYGTKDRFLSFPFKFLYNTIKSIVLYFKIKPDIVITTGTHTAVPMCYIAHWNKKKIVFIETFANITTKTISGGMVYNIADLFVVQWEEMKKLYPNAEFFGGVF